MSEGQSWQLKPKNFWVCHLDEFKRKGNSIRKLCFDQRIISHSETSTSGKETSFGVATNGWSCPQICAFGPKRLWVKVACMAWHYWAPLLGKQNLSKYRLSFRKTACFYFSMNLFLDSMPVNYKDQCSCGFSECNKLFFQLCVAFSSSLSFREKQSWLSTSRDNSLGGSQILGIESFKMY